MKKTLLISIAVLLFQYTYSQEENWPVKILDDFHVSAKDISETYDNAFLILGWYKYSGSARFSFLTKVDINGNEIWKKAFGKYNYYNTINHFSIATDNTIFIAGNTFVHSNTSDPVVAKLTPCGEKLWCRIFRTDNHSDYGANVLATNDGGCLVYLRYSDPYNMENRIELVKLDNNGSVEWRNFHQAGENLHSEDFFDLISCPEGGYLLGGSAYHIYSGTNARLNPYIAKFSNNGELEWDNLPFIFDINIGGEIFNSKISNDGNFIYSSIRQINWEPYPGGYMPTILKHDMDGNFIDYYPLVDTNHFTAIANSINIDSDSTLVMRASANMEIYQYSKPIVKTDTLGNIIDSINVYSEGDASCWVTSGMDNKYAVIVANASEVNTGEIFFYKLNNNMEYDSLYTQEFEYDYLCDHPIIEDTTNFENCGVITDIIYHKENESTPLTTYPNPCSDYTIITLPEFITQQSPIAPNKASNQTLLPSNTFCYSNKEEDEIEIDFTKANPISFTHLDYQYQDKALIKINNINGQLVREIQTLSGQNEVYINTSDLNSGMYMVSLIVDGNKIRNVKIVVQD
jgi:hypothetical protein